MGTLPLGRDDGRDLPRLEVLSNLITVNPFVHDPIYQLWQRRAWLKARRKDRGIVAGAAG